MMRRKATEQSNVKRTPIAQAELETAIAETVRARDPECAGLIGLVIERIVPPSPGAANWAIKGIKYGKAKREPCAAAIARCVEVSQQQFDLSD